jgi:cytochrome c oxidase subunit II
LLLVSGVSVASDWTERSNVNLRPGVTDISQDVFGLHVAILWVVSVIGLLVYSV